jgi:NAD-dependent deacetylase
LNDVSAIADWLKSARCAAAFTGAGMSTESGIPDFRSPNGVWATNRPVYYREFLASAAARREYWRQKSQAHADFWNARPNAGHEILARWERAGRLAGVITQNIDGLHQLAGSRKVWELHGTAREVSCLSCARRWDADMWVQRFLSDGQAPDCPDCGGPLKHATVSFGQALPETVLEDAGELAQQCDLSIPRPVCRNWRSGPERGWSSSTANRRRSTNWRAWCCARGWGKRSPQLTRSCRGALDLADDERSAFKSQWSVVSGAIGDWREPRDSWTTQPASIHAERGRTTRFPALEK